jgi:hypothetical protein
MSFQVVVSKLSSPVKELVVAVTENGTQLIGESAKDQVEVNEWIEKAGQPDISSDANMQVSEIHMYVRPLRRMTGDSSDPQFHSSASDVPGQQLSDRCRRSCLRGLAPNVCMCA